MKNNSNFINLLNNNSNKTSVTYENTRSILKWFDFMGKKENNY